MAKKYKEIDCTKTCRMTTQLRESKFCTKTAKVYDSKIVFGCKEKLAAAPVEIVNHYNCNYWNMEMYDVCDTCNLGCIKNDNINLKEVQAQRERLNKLMESAGPSMVGFGMSPSKAVDVSKKFKELSGDKSGKIYSNTAIEAAEFANNILENVLNGKSVDIAYFQEYTNNMIKKLNKESGQGVKEIDFYSRKTMGLSGLAKDYDKLLKRNKKTK
jgi:hypothetical protein